MGCTGSKLDDLPAVALCRERCAFLDEAIQKRYGVAGAHLAYIHSLRELGVSLHRFFDQDLVNSAGGPPSPVLNLPSKRKGDPEPSGSFAAAPAPAIHHSHSHSHSGSHLHFNSDSEDGDSASDSLHLHSDNTTPVHPYSNYGYADQETLGSYQGGGFTNINYMRNKATPSVVYEQRPMSPETVHMAESSSYNPYPYGNQNPNPYSYSGYPNYGSNNPNYGSNYGGGFFGSSPPPPYGYSAPQQHQLSASSMASSSKPPPPPPSPPRGSAWDFLNPFEVVERYYPPYTPSRDSKEVREEEGIPDLEDEDYQQEIVKEVHGHQKFVDVGGGGGRAGDNNYSKAVADDVVEKAKSVPENHYHTRPSVSMEDDDAVEYEVHVVDKKVVDKEDRSGERQAATGGGFQNDSEVVKEIQIQFERASDSGNDLAKILEVGKLPYNKKHSSYLVSSKMLPIVTSQPSTSIENTDLDGNDDIALRSGGLSSTLQKLHLWEKKLYEEVKVEERMRVLHERKLRKLKRLDEKGAEAHRVDATRSLVRSLSTKIRISIQVVDKISVKINKVRDEDLWPQLNELIQGLARMWKSMLECHHSQSRAIVEARRLDAIVSRKHMSNDGHRQATKHLALELLKWISRFSDWVIYQKQFVASLNSWLLKCLLYEPEETPDGIVPFSPGRIGAPPVFIICNQWSQAMDQISEKEVVDAMRDFASRVLQIWERDKAETQQGQNRDSDRRVKSVMDREEANIHKEIQALEKRMVLVDNNLAVYQSDTGKNTSLQVSLQRFFEAMERFTASSLKVYEELLQRIEEDKLDDREEQSETETV